MLSKADLYWNGGMKMEKSMLYTGEYRNLFREIGISDEDINHKIDQTFNTMFFDPVERIYFETEDHMGYMMDTGNLDARTEGMSYGMMMAVQMDRQDIFDKLWLFSKTYMQQTDGKYMGYFAWSVKPTGEKNAEGPAPDGEEYFALALLFAGRRWGDREAPFDYSVQAKSILKHCLHQAELVPSGDPMWEPSNHYIKFVPEAPFTDPSYHLPHFYELFAAWGNPGDQEFWKSAAAESRKFLQRTAHPVTGMAPEYAEYDGKPRRLFHDGEFYSDAYRVAMNLGLDACWFGPEEALGDIVDRLQTFFSEHAKPQEYHNYKMDGTALDMPALHPVAIIATNAAGSLAIDDAWEGRGKYAKQWVKDFWELPLRTGDRRYYDNCLYFFCLLMLAGRYRIL